jgi:hypothetical protein
MMFMQQYLKANQGSLLLVMPLRSKLLSGQELLDNDDHELFQNTSALVGDR